MVYLVMTVYIYEKREAHRDLMPHSPANANRWHIFTENHCQDANEFMLHCLQKLLKKKKKKQIWFRKRRN